MTSSSAHEDRLGATPTDPAGVEQVTTARPQSSGYDVTLDGQQPAMPLMVSSATALKDWDRYEILGLLGKGGMGVVYKARDRRLGRIVALKFIRSDDPVLTQRLQQEARAQARIEHEHICKVYEVGEVNGQAYIAMQFIEGQTLSAVHYQLNRADKVLIMATIARAIHAAHRLGIIHRDLKPSNVMMEPGEDGRWHPYLMDFGVAHDDSVGRGLTQTGTLLGTPQYMSPEQARGDIRKIDRRSDVYSLGAMLYELLTGELPFAGDGLTEILLQVLDAPPRPLRQIAPDLPIDLETITLKCLQKDQAARYDSAKALAEDLKRYLDDVPVLARRTSLAQKIYETARRHKPLVVLGAALLASLLGLIAYGARTRLEARARELQAQRQAELAQHLGQEIKDMEWLLRSSRQLQLHDLGREKVIIRKRMNQLQTELLSYGELSRGIAHYALGRGHLTLREYPQALSELQQAIDNGHKSADVHYALGLVLGKHFEQAMYEARLSGGGDWANKQRKELEAKYLVPAIASLQRSRVMKLDAPQYLEGLIAYYQRDYDAALKQAAAALGEAPWLYEASKLAGDVHLERALQARYSGHDEQAAREFASAVTSYEAAAAEGHSDGEVYEGLAEAWVRQIEMALNRGQPSDLAYAAAVSASDKITVAEPQSIAGPLKKAFAAMMTMGVSGAGLSSAERVQRCLAAAAAVLERQPGHPYASDAASNCNLVAAEGARVRGEDPEPFFRKSLELLEPTVKKFPHFLWGISDLGNACLYRGIYLQLHGNPAAVEMIQKSVQYYAEAAALDPTFITASNNSLGSLVLLIPEARSESELQDLLARADDWLGRCKAINSQEPQCYNNYFQSYARAVRRDFQAGKDPQPRLQRALENLARTRQLGGSFLDAEQHAALAHLVKAGDKVRRKQDPAEALAELHTDLTRCFASASADAMCRTLAAQAEWVQADWQASQNQPVEAALVAALAKAELASQSSEPYPDAWQTIAEAHLRLARNAARLPKVRDRHVAEGLGSVQKLFAINPSHAQGLATQGALQLVAAQSADPATQQLAARTAAQSLAAALQRDPFLRYSYEPLLTAAQALAQLPNPQNKE